MKFNKVFGYFIEVTKANMNSVPERYIRKQTLVNAERYIIPELKDFEVKILSSDEKIKNIEYELFVEIRKKVAENIDEIQVIANSVAIFDVIAAFAEIAKLNNYIRPAVNNRNKIEIQDGRHPVVEKIVSGQGFIPNDVHMDSDENLVIILTGPNMAGKCCHGDTLIFSENGILPIKDFEPEKSKIGDFNELNVNIIGKDGIKMTSHFYKNGIEEILYKCWDINGKQIT